MELEFQLELEIGINVMRSRIISGMIAIETGIMGIEIRIGIIGSGIEI